MKELRRGGNRERHFERKKLKSIVGKSRGTANESNAYTGFNFFVIAKIELQTQAHIVCGSRSKIFLSDLPFKQAI
jgi:hypothetical protein